jgi:hypothetical protein
LLHLLLHVAPRQREVRAAAQIHCTEESIATGTSIAGLPGARQWPVNDEVALGHDVRGRHMPWLTWPFALRKIA